MPYLSLYRKWRPEVFADVVGQDSIVKTLENSLNNGRIAHAYLFTGPRGTGKTSVARILAKGLNCQNGPTSTPCGACEECLAIKEGTSLNVVEIDGASNRGIDDVRELRSQVQFTAINANYKVYIIDEVHMLTTEAFNALLKTLEEPPSHVVFVFATTDPHRLPPTILSRVQRYDFGTFTEQAMVSRLTKVANEEEFDADAEGLRLIAVHAEGGMRDALGILEKCATFGNGKITAETVAEVLGVAPQEQVDLFTRHIVTNAKSDALQIIDDLYNQGRDLNQFARTVISKLRQDVLSDAKEHESLRLYAIAQLSETVREMRFAPDPRIALELAILKITTPKVALSSPDTDRLAEKVQALEKHIAKLELQLSQQTGKEPKGAPASTATPKRRAPIADDDERSAFLVENWPDYLKSLRDERLMQCEAFLKEGSPVEVVDDRVVIAFPRDRGFHKASIEQDSHREPAERVLSMLMGKQVRFECVFQDGSAPAKQVVPKERKTEKGKHRPEQDNKAVNVQLDGETDPGVGQKAQDAAAEEFLKASMETFGGKIISKPKGN